MHATLGGSRRGNGPSAFRSKVTLAAASVSVCKDVVIVQCDVAEHGRQ